MTVKELKEILDKYPDNTTICYFHDEFFEYFTPEVKEKVDGKKFLAIYPDQKENEEYKNED